MTRFGGVQCVTSDSVTSHPVTSHPVTSDHVTSDHVTSDLVTPRSRLFDRHLRRGRRPPGGADVRSDQLDRLGKAAWPTAQHLDQAEAGRREATLLRPLGGSTCVRPNFFFLRIPIDFRRFPSREWLVGEKDEIVEIYTDFFF